MRRLAFHSILISGLCGSAACGGGTSHSIDAASGADARLVDGAPTADADPNAPGKFAFTWVITKGGMAATCATVGADRFTALETPVGQAYLDIYLCTDGADLSAPIPPDHYAVTLQLTNSNGTPDPSDDTIIATLPDVQEDLPPGGMVTVPTATFAL
jgi:hypothetical protein